MHSRFFATLFTASVLAFTMGAPADAQTTNPYWIRSPDPDATGDFMPAFANDLGINGQATIRCLVEKAGSPSRCEVVSEAPDGLGFGAAGIQVVMTGYLSPKIVDGRPQPGVIQSTVHFQAFPIDLIPATVTPWSGPAPTPRAIELAEAIVERDLPKMLAEKVYDLRGLAPERHAEVMRWIDELIPVDKHEVVTTMGLILARTVSEADLAAQLANRTPPSTVPGLEEWDEASSDIVSRKTLKGLQALHDRYCAHYACSVD
jgi:hypothetical protein